MRFQDGGCVMGGWMDGRVGFGFGMRVLKFFWVKTALGVLRVLFLEFVGLLKVVCVLWDEWV